MKTTVSVRVKKENIETELEGKISLISRPIYLGNYLELLFGSQPEESKKLNQVEKILKGNKVSYDRVCTGDMCYPPKITRYIGALDKEEVFDVISEDADFPDPLIRVSELVELLNISPEKIFGEIEALIEKYTFTHNV